MYKKNQVVWAKLKNYPWWPALVQKYINPGHYVVQFLGQNNHAQISQDFIQDYESNRAKHISTKKNKDLLNAIDQAQFQLSRNLNLDQQIYKPPKRIKRKRQESQDLKLQQEMLLNQLANIAEQSITKKHRHQLKKIVDEIGSNLVSIELLAKSRLYGMLVMAREKYQEQRKSIKELQSLIQNIEEQFKQYFCQPPLHSN